MASFFQPTNGGVSVPICGNESHAKVYCNSILPSNERLVFSYQWLTFILAITALGVPTVLAVGERLINYHRSWRKRRKSPSTNEALDRARPKEPSPCLDLSTVQSFGYFGKESPVPNFGKLTAEHDLLIVTLPFVSASAAAIEEADQGSFSETSSTIAGVPASRPVLGVVDGQDLGRTPSGDVSPTVDHLASLLRNNAVVGLVLDTGLVPEHSLSSLPQILMGLSKLQVPVFLKCHHDSKVLGSTNFKYVSGIIIENACMMEDGTRRDYFRSIALRDAMAKCADQRLERPNFFIGFLERWHTRPSAAVVRRSQKLADHFAAAFEHGRAPSPNNPSNEYQGKLPLSLSAFEYLRRPETSELQSSWMQRKRDTHVGNGRRDSVEKVASLPFGELQQLIPNIDELLMPLPLSDELQSLRSERPVKITPPDYVPYAPIREEFWDYTSQGDEISPYGCVPLLSEPTGAQYDAILDTQIHLRSLKMLQRASEAEVTKLIEAYGQYPQISKYYSLVQSLVTGLKTQQVFIYKGLGSGFTLPDNVVELWGVSASKQDSSGQTNRDSTMSEVELFISRRCSGDLATVLHTWLAHHEVPRIERYEEELAFERVLNPSEIISLPQSIRSEIDTATPAEILFLLEQIKVSSMTHDFKYGIEEQCRAVLLDNTSIESWNYAASFGFLGGSQPIEALFRRRLQDFVRMGANRLPSVSNLLQLYKCVDRLVVDAMFSGDREKLNVVTDALLRAFDPWNSWTDSEYIDVNADLFALIFFSALRSGAFEDVYIETTDRCPFFLSQRDQAAVFSELWALGSQCEAYFGMLPRDLGEIIYDRYREFLEDHPPPAGFKDKRIMTAFAKPEPGGSNDDVDYDGHARKGFDVSKTVIDIRRRFADFGALSIFCLPAIIDILLLTFLGRGLFMTAWLGDDYLTAACYALLMSLLISAGVTGWVGSIGNYYICNYAYDNMIYFHVQRLSGGFVITIIVAIVGFIIFAVKMNPLSGLVFFLYLVAISMYLNVLGVMATMHQRGSPLTSGRTVLWRTIPLFFLSPLISTFSSNHDLQIYLPVTYGFLVIILIQYRSLCHEWSTWMDKIPRVGEKDVMSWYNAKLEAESSSGVQGGGGGNDKSAERVKAVEDVSAEVKRKMGLLAFRREVEAYSSGIFGFGATAQADPVVVRVAKGMPYLDWLLKKDDPARPRADTLTPAWFGQVNQALKTQEQLAQGLKEHNIFLLFRYSRFDIGVSVGLFLVALMDRWVSIVMSARYAAISVFVVDQTARYGICFAILYFCASVMTLDGTLQKHWSGSYALSEEKLLDLHHAEQVEKDWESRRRKKYLGALFELSQRLIFWFGLSCMLLWVFVKKDEIVILYYAYCIAYTAVMIFQFNRCFTTDVAYHTASILISAMIGFVVGCILHGIYGDNEPLYLDVIALNVSALCAAGLTTFFVWKDLHIQEKDHNNLAGGDNGTCWTQPRLSSPSMSVSETAEIVPWKSLPGKKVTVNSTAMIGERIAELLRVSISQPNQHAQNAAWSEDVLKVALEMWKAGRIELNISTRTAFIDSGFGSSMSFSRYDMNILEISTGYLLEDEVDVPTWQPLLAYFVTEAILFHIARAIFHMERNRAIQAEHFLHETEQMSRRIDFELSTSDLPTLFEIQAKTNLKVMKHLCMGVHVDTRWRELPTYVRQVIMCRVLGEPVSVSRDLHEWMAGNAIDLQTCDFHLEIALGIFEKTQEREHLNAEYSLETGTAPLAKAELHCSPVHVGPQKYGAVRDFVSNVMAIPNTFTKWVGIITGAGSDVEREIWYNVRYWYARGLVLYITLTFWRFCWFLKNIWVYSLLIYHRKNLVRMMRLAKKGASRTLVKDRVIIEQPRKIITGFATRNEENSITLDIFDRALTTRPTDVEPISTAVYDDFYRLATRQDKSASDDKDNPFAFSTYFFAERSRSRWPSYKEVVDGDNFKRCFYDKYGRVTHGITMFSGKEYEFTYSYKSSPKNSHEILRAEYTLSKVVRSDSFAVYWGVPLRADVGAKLDWVPSDRVCRVVRKIGNKRYTTTSNYAHRRDPTMVTVLEDGPTRCMISSPPEVFPEEALMQKRPTDVAFENDDLFIRHHRDDVRRIFKYAGRLSVKSFETIINPGAWRYFSKKKIYTRVPTWWLRTELWNNWLKSHSLDGITACWMDELILRQEPTLQKYWSYRSSGQLTSAKKVLDENIEQIVAAIEIEKDVSEVCMLPIKAADLYAMGLGKDANQMTTRPEDCYKDTRDRISVIFNDVGCWPEAPGGVSNCRRDLVNGHSTIRNHVLAESANEYGIPRFQIERNVQSLKILPLWGLDGKTPNHGVIDNLLQSEVDRKIGDTETKRDVIGTFVPLLKQFVKGARTRSVSRADLLHFSNVMLTMFKYFEHKDYNITWNSKEVAAAWVDAWLASYDDENIMDPSESFELSRPTMTDFRDAMAIYKSYFFIFSVQTPENCPRVFQSTHHGISSLFGMLLKYKRGTTFGIWDHAILWRECCLNISPAQCELSIPVQTMLLAGIGLATRLAYFHADVILPCTSFFNPIWEADLGTDRGKVNHRNQFRRKIDPIVNGVGNMDAFKPVDKVRTEVPTVIMLSNVQFIKDVRTAVLAADVIINKFGFKDYRLVVYGAQDREPQYTIDTIKLIQQCKMSDKVILGGFGRPQEVLKDAWLFMNSSLSEGLPLAIAEAALAGVPIVATSVGATALVLTDPDDTEKKYGEVVPPNDPVALARAQISMLSMVGPWAKFTGEVSEKEAVPANLTLPDVIQPSDVEWLTGRMYEKAEYRRKLGMLSRGVVLKGFHGKRYLREHEQMYWIQWHMAQMRADEVLMAPATRSFRFGAPMPLRYSDVTEEELWAETEEMGVLDVSQSRGNNYWGFPMIGGGGGGGSAAASALEEGRHGSARMNMANNPYATAVVSGRAGGRGVSGLGRKKSIRWQEFPASTRGSFLTVGSYDGKRLSKTPRRPWVESRAQSMHSVASSSWNG